MSLLSPQRDNKPKVPIVQTKITKSPPSSTTRTITFGSSKVVSPFLRQSPNPNPEGKKVIVQKQGTKTKTQNTSLKDLEHKLGEIDTKLAAVREPEKLKSPGSQKKQNSKIQTKKSSVEAVQKKKEAQSPSSGLYRKDAVRKTCPDVVKAFQTSKMLVSPSQMLINPRMTADNQQKAKMSKLANQAQLIQAATSRKSFKINNLEMKRVESNKQLKSNEHGTKNTSSNLQQNAKMRVTMSNKLLQKPADKKGPIVNLFNGNQSQVKTQKKSQNCKTENSIGLDSNDNIKNSSNIDNVQFSMIKEKKKLFENVGSSSTIFTSSMKAGLSSLTSSRNNISVPTIAKKQLYKQPKQAKQQKQPKQLKQPNQPSQPTQPETKITDFKILKPLGSGKFSEVFLGFHKKLGFLVAIKQISKQKVKSFNMIRQVSDEIKLHSALNHPNIIKFFGLLQDDENIYLILEYIEGGSLFDQLAQNVRVPYRQTAIYLKDVISGIQYLHERSIAHRDIKPENILIGMNCVAKICDLGWSAVILTSRKTYCGTFDYVPPQILQKKDYDLSVDIWCLGVLTYQLLTGKVPYQGDKHTVVMNKIKNVQIQYPEQCPQFPLQAKQYIQWLLQHNPQQRPKSKQLLEHKFFQIARTKSSEGQHGLGKM